MGTKLSRIPPERRPDEMELWLSSMVNPLIAVQGEAIWWKEGVKDKVEDKR